jgi:hypothetical protein
MTGYVNAGVSCTPAKAQTYVAELLRALNLQFRNRFVEKIPPTENVPPPLR